MGAFIYDTNGMLLFSGADKAAALAYAKLFALAQFTLVVREPRRPAASPLAVTFLSPASHQKASNC